MMRIFRLCQPAQPARTNQQPFWNWIDDGPGSGGVGLHGDFNMTGSYMPSHGGELPGIEPPEEWKRYFDWQRQFRTRSAS